MSTKRPWIIAPDAVRALTVIATTTQVAAVNGRSQPHSHAEVPGDADLITVSAAGLVRTGWLADIASQQPPPDEVREYQIRLLPLLIVPGFEAGFTTCGFGWALCEAPARDGEQVEVTEGRADVFRARVVGDAIEFGRWWRALLHIDHHDDPDMPACAVLAVPPGASEVAVPADRLLGKARPHVGGLVELVGPRRVRSGRVLGTSSQAGRSEYWIELTEPDTPRLDVTATWTRPAPGRPRLTPDRFEAFLAFADPQEGGWPTAGGITRHMSDRHFPQEQLGEAAMRVAETIWHDGFREALTGDQQEAVLRIVAMREADDRHLDIDWQAMRTWVDLDEDGGGTIAHGQFPLLPPLFARTPGVPS